MRSLPSMTRCVKAASFGFARANTSPASRGEVWCAMIRWTRASKKKLWRGHRYFVNEKISPAAIANDIFVVASVA